jgi:hypothetical protein
MELVKLRSSYNSKRLKARGILVKIMEIFLRRKMLYDFEVNTN